MLMNFPGIYSLEMTVLRAYLLMSNPQETAGLKSSVFGYCAWSLQKNLKNSLKNPVGDIATLMQAHLFVPDLPTNMEERAKGTQAR